MTTHLWRAAAAFALAGALGAGDASAAGKNDKGRQREVVVGCTSTVAYDAGGCRKPARKKCKSEAKLVGVLANTPMAESGLHVITARYRCVN